MRLKIFILILFFFQISPLFCETYFQKLINAAYKNNYIIKSYQKYTESVKKNINIVNGFYFPKINFSYNFIYSNEPGQAALLKAKQGKFSMQYYFKHMANPPYVKDHQFIISLIQPIFQKGKISLSKKQAELNYDAAIHSLKEIKREIKFKIFQLLINANKLFDEIEIARNLKRKATIYFNTAQNLYKNGMALKSDYFYAKFHLKESEIRLESLKNDLNKIKFALYQITGNHFPLKRTNFNISDKIDLNSLINFGINNRDDILAFSDYVKIAKIEIEKRKREFLPEVYGFANYERNSQYLTELDEDGYTFGIGMKFNIFNGMIDKIKLDQAKLNFIKIKNLLNDKKENLKKEIKDAYVDYKNAKYTYETMKKLVNTNRTALQISERRFKHGVERITTLVDMETNYKNSLNRMTQAKWDMIFNYYKILYKAGKF